MEKDSKLQFSILDLREYNFKIPEYQRGYRWEKNEIINLLEDIKDSITMKKDNYYLQQIMVKPESLENNSDKRKKYLLIDGQQRLTTILIILTFLGVEDVYTIMDVEKEKDENTKSRNEIIKELLDEKRNPKEINEFYYKNTIKVVDEYFKKNEEIIQEFQVYVQENVKIIWYLLTDNDDENKRFININTNHIPLESSDLVKAELLSKANVHNAKVAIEYDEIERELNINKFWYFISNKEESSRMDKLLEINLIRIGKKKLKTEKYSLYNTYKDLLRQKDKEEYDYTEVWNQIKETYKILKEFYKDVELYNLVGYLVAITEAYSRKTTDAVGNIIINYENAKNSTKTNFKKSLYKEIIENIDIEKKNEKTNQKEKIIQNLKTVEELKEVLNNKQNFNYADTSSAIKKILLLHNILTLNDNDNKERFPFDLYYQTEWNLEHIQSQVDSEIKGDEKEDYINYLKICAINNFGKVSFNLNHVIEKINDLSTLEDKKQIKEIGDNILKEDIQYNNDSIEKDCIYNLTLLDAQTNKEYQNKLFMRKREKIIEKNKFIPICTQKVFLRGYTTIKENTKTNKTSKSEHQNELMQFFEWNKQDAENYLSDIAEKIYAIKEAQNEKE